MTSKAKPRTNENQPQVSVEELLELGGKKVGTNIVFGPKGETQLIFRPTTQFIFRPKTKTKLSRASKDRLNRVLARCAVSLKAKTSRHDARRELNKANRGLWDKGEDKDEEEGEPSIAFKAARQLLACHVEIELQLRRRLFLLLLYRLHEKAKQEALSPIEPEPAEGALYIYPKPELETLGEQLAVANEQLAEAEEQFSRVSHQRAMAHDAISLTTEALSQELGGKVQLAFELLQSDQWPQDIDKLQEHAMALATELQRPPTKAELRKRHDPSGTLRASEFSPLLKRAGLSWLKRGSE